MIYRIDNKKIKSENIGRFYKAKHVKGHDYIFLLYNFIPLDLNPIKYIQFDSRVETIQFHECSEFVYVDDDQMILREKILASFQPSFIFYSIFDKIAEY